jgi:hypothetical protein
MGAIELRSGQDSTGAWRLAVVPAPDADEAAVRSLLDRVAAAHAAIDHPMVPRVISVAPPGQPPGLLLDCDAVVDVETLVGLVAETRYQLDLSGATAFAIEVVKMLHHVHVSSAARGRPLCLGAFSAANVVVSPDGRFHVLGWGHPPHGRERSALLSLIPSTFTAPEVSFGVAPGPGSDLHGAVLLFHSFFPLGSMPEPVVRAMRGESMAGFEALPGLVVELMMNSHAVAPEQRDIPRFLEVFDRALAVLGMQPDPALLRRDLAELVQRWRAGHEGPAPIEVGHDGRWFRVPGSEVVWLERRGSLRRMVLALAQDRLQRPGQARHWEELVEVAWPGQHPTPESARNRVYVAIANLRNLGLREALVTHDEGYLIDPALPLSLVESAPDEKKSA